MWNVFFKLLLLFFFLPVFQKIYVKEPESVILLYQVFYAQIKWQIRKYWIMSTSKVPALRAGPC